MRFRGRTLRLRSKLTGRGLLLGLVGVGFLVGGTLLWQRDLLRIGLLLACTPLLSFILLRAIPRSLRVERSIRPERVQVGTAATVTLTVHNTSRFSSRLALASETLPYRLGPPPKFVLDNLAGDQRVTVHYRVSADLRGPYTLGPLNYRMSDPFGMWVVKRADAGVEQIVVRPAVHPLGGHHSAAGSASGGDIGQRTVAPVGEFDVAAREYRHGDDLRRVHWPSTARRGELMMRSEEQSQERLATVLLDARTATHDGEGTRSTFEWAITAVASICEHLAEQGYSIRLLTDGNDPGWVAGDDSLARDHLHERLALLHSGPGRWFSDACDLIATQPVAELVIAVLGDLSTAEAQHLAAARTGVAFVKAAHHDLNAPPTAAEGLLAQGGWTSVRFHAGSDLESLWAESVNRRAAAHLDVGLHQLPTHRPVGPSR